MDRTRRALRLQRAVAGPVASALAILVGSLLFASGQGAVHRSAEPTDGASAAVRATVAEIEGTGERCGSRPVLTDAVVVEAHDGTASVVSFDEALERTASGAGAVRAYCR